MKLLVFAHRGEAQIFLKNLALKSHPRMNELYIGEYESILISGEGIYESISKTSFALGLLPETKEIVNIGICGAFSKSIELGSIHSIAHVYGEDEFKSFPCIEKDSNAINCITAKERVLTTQKASQLQNIAPLVDRELWALAKVSKDFGVPINSIKLVSDHIQEAAICEYIKANAEDYSDKLFAHYQQNMVSSDEVNNSQSFNIFENEDFYFTVSMKRSISNLLNSLLNKYPHFDEISLLNDIGMSSIQEQDCLPKQRAKELEESLKRKLYPLKYKINSELESLKNDINSMDMNLKFDETLEKVGFGLTTHFNSKEDFQKKIKRLSSFNWQKLNDIFEGKF